MKRKISKGGFLLAKSRLGDLIIGLAFGKFSKLLPVKKIAENKKVVAFWHPYPSWEKHIVIVPKKQIDSLTSIRREDFPYIGECLQIAGSIAKKLKWDNKRWSVIAHGGTGQKVNQLHFHLNCGKLLE